MPGLLAWVLLGAFIALAIFLSFRKKAAKPPERKHEEWSSDLILDLGQKRFHDAMKEHLLKERNSENDWQTFQYIHVLPGGDRMKPQELERRIAEEFKIDPKEAHTRLASVLKGAQTVRRRAGTAPN